MRALTVVLLSSLSACQCLVPVEDDGGVSLDGSVLFDAGVPECESPADCNGPTRVTNWCNSFGGDGGAWSCVQNR